MHWHAIFFSFSRQNLEYFDTSHTFLPLTELKLSVQKQSGFCILSVGLQENHRILITAMIIGTICAKSALCVCIKCCSVLFLFSGLGQFITRHGFHLNFLPFVKRFLLRIDPLCMEEFGHGMTRFKLVSLLCIYSASRQWLWRLKAINNWVSRFSQFFQKFTLILQIFFWFLSAALPISVAELH